MGEPYVVKKLLSACAEEILHVVLQLSDFLSACRNEGRIYVP
jgi:hypothetical protein